MKKILAFLICFFGFLGVGFCAPVQKGEDFEAIYDRLESADFEYIFSLDPYQPEDYQKYIVSPYPLLRTGVEFVFKDTKIPPGYYLLTPREKYGVQYVLFKQNGKVQYIIPTYKKELVDPGFYKMHVPAPEKTKTQKMADFGNKLVGKMAKQSKATPPPQAYIDVNQIGNEFWQVILYYGNDKYYMIFRQQ